jgi:hypothetical protein
MHDHMEYDPYLIRERTQQIFGPVQALRLEKRLRKNHQACGSHRPRPSPQEHGSFAPKGRSRRAVARCEVSNGQHEAGTAGRRGRRSGRHPHMADR